MSLRRIIVINTGDKNLEDVGAEDGGLPIVASFDEVAHARHWLRCAALTGTYTILSQITTDVPVVTKQVEERGVGKGKQWITRAPKAGAEA